MKKRQTNLSRRCRNQPYVQTLYYLVLRHTRSWHGNKNKTWLLFPSTTTEYYSSEYVLQRAVKPVPLRCMRTHVMRRRSNRGGRSTCPHFACQSSQLLLRLCRCTFVKLKYYFTLFCVVAARVITRPDQVMIALLPRVKEPGVNGGQRRS